MRKVVTQVRALITVTVRRVLQATLLPHRAIHLATETALTFVVGERHRISMKTLVAAIHTGLMRTRTELPVRAFASLHDRTYAGDITTGSISEDAEDFEAKLS